MPGRPGQPSRSPPAGLRPDPLHPRRRGADGGVAALRRAARHWPCRRACGGGVRGRRGHLRRSPNEHRRRLSRAPSQQPGADAVQRKVALNLEDRRPVDGPRPVFMVDIMNPCWIWPQARSDRRRRRSSVGVGRVAVQLPARRGRGQDRPCAPPATPDGELEVRLRRLRRPPIASAAAGAGRWPTRGQTTLTGAHARAAAGRARPLLQLHRETLDPMWVSTGSNVGARPRQRARRDA